MDNSIEEAKRLEFKENIDKEVDKMINVEVKPNMLQQQQFTYSIEGDFEKVMQYEEELN